MNTSARRVRFACVVGGSDAALIPHMVEHYRSLGIDSFQIIRHADSPNSPGFRESEERVRECGIEFFHTHIGPYSVSLQQRLIRYAMDEYPDDWYVAVDSDEFHVYDRPLPELIALCERKGYDYVGGCFLDRVGADGGFPDIADDDLWTRFPLAGALSAGLLRAIPFKVGLVRGALELFGGQHGTAVGRGLPYSESYIQIHHFKWTATVVRRLEERAQKFDADPVLRNTHSTIVREINRFLTYLRRHGGVLDVRDARLHLHPTGRAFSDHPQWTEIVEDAQRWQGMMA